MAEQQMAQVALQFGEEIAEWLNIEYDFVNELTQEIIDLIYDNFEVVPAKAWESKSVTFSVESVAVCISLAEQWEARITSK